MNNKRKISVISIICYVVAALCGFTFLYIYWDSIQQVAKYFNENAGIDHDYLYLANYLLTPLLQFGIPILLTVSVGIGVQKLTTIQNLLNKSNESSNMDVIETIGEIDNNFDDEQFNQDENFESILETPETVSEDIETEEVDKNKAD